MLWPSFVRVEAQEPSNANVRCPNMNRAIYQVVVEGKERVRSGRIEQGEVLEKLYDENSSILEEAVEEDHTPFLDHQDRVKASAAAVRQMVGGATKQQLDKIHNVIVN